MLLHPEPEMRLAAFIVFVVSYFGAGLGWSLADEENLQRTLLTNYTTTVRPYSLTKINLILVPLSLNALDIGQQLTSFTNIFFMVWHDGRLMWNPSNYSNIEYIVLSPSTIWTPPVVVEKAITDVGKMGGKGKDNTLLRIQSTGRVFWLPPMETRTSCEMRIARYPFDRQTCSLILTTWAVSTSEVTLTARPINFIYYSPNGEWDIQNYWTTNGTFFDGANTYNRLFVSFTLRRKWQFYAQNLLLPIVLTSLLMCFVFLLPIDSGEKVGYALTVLLSYVVFLTWVTDNLPSISNDVSVLQVYLAIVLCLGVVAIVLTVWVIHLYHREPHHTMSAAMRVVVRYLLLPLRNFTCGNSCRRKRVEVQDIDIQPAVSTPQKSRAPDGKSLPLNINDDGRQRCEDDRDHSQETEVTQEEDCSWPEVAAMFDRLFFILFLVLVPFASCVVVGILYDGY